MRKLEEYEREVDEILDKVDGLNMHLVQEINARLSNLTGAELLSNLEDITEFIDVAKRLISKLMDQIQELKPNR